VKTASPARRIGAFRLRLAAAEAGRQGQNARLWLLGALWDAEDWESLGQHATRLRLSYPTHSGVHAALFASAYQDGRVQDAIEHLARAFCYSYSVRLAKASPRLARMIEGVGGEFLQEVQTRTMSMLVELSDQLEGGVETAETVLPGMSLSDVLNRVYDYNKYEDPLDPRVIDTLIGMSESAWDRADYSVAINARRRACQFIERTGDIPRLAVELGWLATLVKQAGNLEEALSLFQRAIDAGADHLSPRERCSLLGRYANLLHKIGDYDPAVRMQWLAVLAQKEWLPGPRGSFPPAKEVLDSALDPDGLDTIDLVAWPLLAVNLANCLESAGHYDLATHALGATAIAVAMVNRAKPATPGGPFGVETERIFANVRARLAARGMGVPSIPE